LQDLSNIIVRISDGTPEGKEHAVLFNRQRPLGKLDSTLPSPVAADDAFSVGIMLDCMRVLIGTPDWSPKHAIIFLFNHTEESLQDGSHLFSTQHPIASTVRAAVNLEAAGSSGREILFQATSEQMIEAYSHIPRPYGTIFANDIFSSGIILSDTDFRQFELYLNVTGLDMAIVGNSYLYHMRKVTLFSPPSSRFPNSCFSGPR
jgi:Zn-dependent M28 family amino/carboxypeptidase